MKMLKIVLRSLSESTVTLELTRMSTIDLPTTRGRPNLSAVSSAVVLIRSNDTRTSHVRDLFAFYLMPNDRINN